MSIIESNRTINENWKKNPNVFSRIKNKISSHIKDLWDLFKMSDNEESWNNFPQETKKEMLESMSMKNIVDLYSIDIKNLSKPAFLDHETVDFREWTVKKDKIWNYIEIDGLKCRQWQPGITWFTYEDIRDRYYINQWLKIGFCDKWKFDKCVTINSTWKPKTADWMPNDIEQKVWWPFFVIDDPKEFQSSKYYNTSWDDLFKTRWEKELGVSDVEGPWIINNWNKELQIEWINHVQFKKWISGFAYQEFPSAYWECPQCILIGKFKNWNLVWDWVIIDADKKTFIRSSKK